jgi:hypothetical protein
MASTLKTNARRMGKTALMEKELAEYLKKNPKAVIARCSIKGTIVEKPVEGEVVGLDLLPAPKCYFKDEHGRSCMRDLAHVGAHKV